MVMVPEKKHVKTLKIVVEPNDVGMRLDSFLSKRLPKFSRAQIGKLIKLGKIASKVIIKKPAKQVLAHEIYSIEFDKKNNASFMKPQEIPLDILFSDEHIAVINKPSGMVVHPGAGIRDGTLCNALLYHFPDMSIGNIERPGIVHRLDKDTSGIMVIAKTEEAHQNLSDDFKHRRIKKIYRAFCHGEIQEKSFELKTGHMRHPYNRIKFFTKIQAPKMPSPNIRLAHTLFEVLSSGFGICEIKATLYTGRTHQIRAHLSDIDHPLLGDDLYGGRRSLKKSMPKTLNDAIVNLNGQALFAESLEFRHPISKKLLYFSAALPKILSNIHYCLRRK
jgi:23S rRNA pseudouridine1911/1915/1917 synthase